MLKTDLAYRIISELRNSNSHALYAKNPDDGSRLLRIFFHDSDEIQYKLSEDFISNYLINYL